MGAKRKSISYSKYGYWFISAAVILYTVFMIYPILNSIWLSLHATRGLNSEFVGLDNFKRLLEDPLFRQSLGNNFIFLIVQVPLMTIMGAIFAVMLNSPKLKGRTFFRLALFLPCVTSLVAYSVLFKMMFQADGVVNQLLMSWHIIQEPIGWLVDPFWAKVTIIIALCWRWTGYNMVFYLVGLQNIPSETLEAASIDGASEWKKFIHITLPQLKPIILLTSIMSTIGTLQLFDEPVNLTAGGPANATMTISQYIYKHSFVYSSNFGYAAALSWVLVIIVAILAVIQFKVGDDKE